jgi:hypothetical protein
MTLPRLGYSLVASSRIIFQSTLSELCWHDGQSPRLTSICIPPASLGIDKEILGYIRIVFASSTFCLEAGLTRIHTAQTDGRWSEIYLDAENINLMNLTVANLHFLQLTYTC